MKLTAMSNNYTPVSFIHVDTNIAMSYNAGLTETLVSQCCTSVRIHFSFEVGSLWTLTVTLPYPQQSNAILVQFHTCVDQDLCVWIAKKARRMSQECARRITDLQMTLHDKCTNNV